MTAREKAVERLAGAFACIHNRRGPSHVSDAEQVRRAVKLDTAPFAEVKDLKPLASEVLDALGLVAIDPALVEAVRIPGWEACFSDHEVEQIKLALADAVLEQVRR